MSVILDVEELMNDIFPVDIAIGRKRGSINDIFVDMFENPQRYIESNSSFEDSITTNQKDRVILTPSEWAMKYRNVKGKQMNFERHPYQRQILDDMHPNQVVRKAAQLGISEINLTKVFWFSDYSYGGPSAKIIYTFPTYSDMLTYAAARIPPIIDDGVMIKEGDFGYSFEYDMEPMAYIATMMNADSAKLKRIRDTFLFMKGTFGDNSAISVDSDWNIHDEINFSNQSVLNKFKSRLGAASSMGWEYNFSTPTIPGYGVSKMFQNSDQHFWYVRCPHCNEQFKMDFERHLKELAYGKGYIYQCHKCGNEISDETRAKGFYICEVPSVKDLRGYHIDKMCNPNLSANQLMKSMGDYKRIADFYNFDLGLEYNEKSTSLSHEILVSLKESIVPYAMRSTAKREELVTMGVDQGDTLWVEISATDIETGKPKLIYVEKVDYRDYDDEDPFRRIPELIDRYNVSVCVMDALPNKNSSRALKNKYLDNPKVHFFMAYYTSTKEGDYDVREDDGVVNIDRTEAFKWAFNRIYNQEFAIPTGSDIVDGLWIEHMKNLKKESLEDDSTGAIKEQFVRTGPDHLCHAHLYNEIARSIAIEELGLDNLYKKARKLIASNENPQWARRNKEQNNVYGGVKPVPSSRVRKGR